MKGQSFWTVIALLLLVGLFISTITARNTIRHWETEVQKHDVAIDTIGNGIDECNKESQKAK